ncbi:hypothetical protein NEAUS03_1495 [Nematocida ausubeli]|nr:hypothetical protein NEAUS03_1495 [Nematocida ausubeli]
MAYYGITRIEQMPVEEDIRREGVFSHATMEYINLIAGLQQSHIPLIIHPGKRVKSKREMRQIEENLTETRKPQKVSAQKRPSKTERRKKAQVEEKIKNALSAAEDTREGKPRHKKKERAAQKLAKKQRLGKSRRHQSSNRQ